MKPTTVSNHDSRNEVRVPALGRPRRKLTRWSLLTFVLVGACARGAPLQAQNKEAKPAAPLPPQAPSSMDRMLEPGPEAKLLARQIGTWDVVMTMRPTSSAPPIVVSGMTAERTMVGLYLNEVMKPSPGSKVPDFRRFDHLTYDAVQARWEYASLDTRAPIGIMFAKSYANERGPAITVYFDNFANPGLGPKVGASVRARHIDRLENDDHHIKQQYWTMAGEEEWLAMQYDYTRKKLP